MSDVRDDLPILEHGEKILIITRRLFVHEVRRHFVGSVERYDSGAMRVHGYAFIHDGGKDGFVRRQKARTRIFPLDNHIIVFVLPYETDVGAVRYEGTEESGLLVTDGKNFKLDLEEFNA